MTVYLTKASHYSFSYLLNWQNPDTGAMMGQWFCSMKDVREYISGWNATIVSVN